MVIFTASPIDANFKRPAKLRQVPAWAMSAVVVFEGKSEIQWLPAQLVYYVSRSGKLVIPPRELFCSPIKIHADRRIEELRHWIKFRDWFLTPCLHALCKMNDSTQKQSDFDPNRNLVGDTWA